MTVGVGLMVGEQIILQVKLRGRGEREDPAYLTLSLVIRWVVLQGDCHFGQ